MSKTAKTSKIEIKVGLDNNNVPVRIQWQAEDHPESKLPQDCKAMLLSFFDKNSKETLKIDLWTKDMQVIEMDRFIFQTLRALADTYYRATQNKKMAADMQRFVQFFGEETEIIPRS